MRLSATIICVAALLGLSTATIAAQTPDRTESAVMKGLKPDAGNFVIDNFHFQSGGVLPKLTLHYLTLGVPRRDADGHVTNAVLIMHGTGGSGSQFMRPYFAGELFGAGQPLDTSRYYIILPDDIGHGQSSKPSDGLRASFPHYDYDDMVAAEYALVTKGLGIDHLRLAMGTSMGCMHSFMWGEDYPDFVDALMPLACLPVEIAGRNRMWRKMLLDGIRDDPNWHGGNYTKEPVQGLRTAVDLLFIVGSAPLVLQNELSTARSVDTYLAKRAPRAIAGLDANDMLYQFASSRSYDPSSRLGLIKAQVMWINSADDFINPPILEITGPMVKKIPHAQFVLIPASLATHGHGTHTWAAIWKQYLVKLLDESAH